MAALTQTVGVDPPGEIVDLSSTGSCHLGYNSGYPQCRTVHESAMAEFLKLPNSGGVKALELRLIDSEVSIDGNQVAVHYYGRFAEKQGWRFDSTYDHIDENGEPIPFVFVIGTGLYD
ncbi:hypothetical protein GBA52_026856 [Prunus armeniaca]|nr:hypothetical protein GBA52_026856 [Prunus armeniaca]